MINIHFSWYGPQVVPIFSFELRLARSCLFLFSQGNGVVLVNTDKAGILSVTNFRLLFVVSDVSLKLYSYEVVFMNSVWSCICTR